MLNQNQNQRHHRHHKDNRPYSICCIEASGIDTIKVIGISDEKISKEVEKSIITGWSNRISRKNETEVFDPLVPLELQVEGDPWTGQGFESVSSRKLLVHLLEAMAKNGWNLLQSITITSKSKWDRDSLFFEPGPVDTQVKIFALSFEIPDRIRLIHSLELFPALKEIVHLHWPKGIQELSQFHAALEIKLKGTPFLPDRKNKNPNGRIEKEILMSQIITTFQTNGFKLYGSCDINIHRKGDQDLKTWVFRKINKVYH